MAAIDEVISLPMPKFCLVSGLGHTTVREMLKDGRLKPIRVGKRLLIDVDSYRQYIAKQRVEGVPEYRATDKAIKARREKRAAPGIDLEELGL
jgi:hypothetical protein